MEHSPSLNRLPRRCTFSLSYIPMTGSHQGSGARIGLLNWRVCRALLLRLSLYTTAAWCGMARRPPGQARQSTVLPETRPAREQRERATTSPCQSNPSARLRLDLSSSAHVPRSCVCVCACLLESLLQCCRNVADRVTVTMAQSGGLYLIKRSSDWCGY